MKMKNLSLHIAEVTYGSPVQWDGRYQTPFEKSCCKARTGTESLGRSWQTTGHWHTLLSQNTSFGFICPISLNWLQLLIRQTISILRKMFFFMITFFLVLRGSLETKSQVQAGYAGWLISPPGTWATVACPQRLSSQVASPHPDKSCSVHDVLDSAARHQPLHRQFTGRAKSCSSCPPCPLPALMGPARAAGTLLGQTGKQHWWALMAA